MCALFTPVTSRDLFLAVHAKNGSLVSPMMQPHPQLRRQRFHKTHHSFEFTKRFCWKRPKMHAHCQPTISFSLVQQDPNPFPMGWHDASVLGVHYFLWWPCDLPLFQQQQPIVCKIPPPLKEGIKTRMDLNSHSHSLKDGWNMIDWNVIYL